MPGCQLPEASRQYYLNTMGISCWQSQTVDEQAAIPESVEQAVETEQLVTGDDSWQLLEADVQTCQQCSELAASRTRTVFGVGNRQADILVIGEAPGQDEDAQGEPFVGPAGKLLNAMLLAIELQREQVYIANILKCRPPGDRDPSRIEATNCSAYLKRQIALLQPKAILIVGRIAAQNLLSSELAIGKMRGQDYHYPVHDRHIPVIVTYHPAYLLRKPGEKRKSWQDLLRLKALMESWQ